MADENEEPKMNESPRLATVPGDEKSLRVLTNRVRWAQLPVDIKFDKGKCVFTYRGKCTEQTQASMTKVIEGLTELFGTPGK